MPRIGTRKLYHILYEDLQNIGVGRDKLFMILKANHMEISPRRSYHITTNSYHRFYKHRNMVQGRVPVKPEQLWVSDITYIGSRVNPMYLALVTDAYSKKIVGYDLSNSLETQGTIRAFKMAVKKRSYSNESLIHHSDRGIQYCSNEYQNVLNMNNIKCSMTESYDPYENAVAERVNGILKQEFIIDNKHKKLSVMKKLIANSIDIYNNLRPHYSCFMRTPEQMHRQEKVRIRTYRRKNGSKNELATIN